MRNRDQPGDAGNVDDGAPPLDLVDRCPRQHDGRREVRRDDVAELLWGEAQNGTSVVEARVVDEDVEATEVRNDAFGQRRERIEVGNVGGERGGAIGSETCDVALERRSS